MKNRIRIWIIKKLFTEDEKYLLRLAIEERIYNLDKLKITDRVIDYEYASDDIAHLNNMKKFFSTKLFL